MREIRLAEGIRTDIRFRNIPKGYLLLQTKTRRFIMRLPKHVISISEIFAIGRDSSIMSARCHYKDGSSKVTWLNLPNIPSE